VTVTGDQVAPTRQAISEMIGAALLGHVMAKVGEAAVALTRTGRFLPGLVKTVLERGLGAEMTGHVV
jgi:putative transposase